MFEIAFFWWGGVGRYFPSLFFPFFFFPFYFFFFFFFLANSTEKLSTTFVSQVRKNVKTRKQARTRKENGGQERKKRRKKATQATWDPLLDKD